MAKHATTLHFTLAALIATSASAWAETTALPTSPSKPSLEQPSPVSRVSGVTQFGMPGDHKYIFCDGADCPPRTPKHISEPPPPPPLVMPKPVYVEPPVAEPPARLKAKPTPKHKKRKAHKPVKKHTNDCAVSK